MTRTPTAFSQSRTFVLSCHSSSCSGGAALVVLSRIQTLAVPSQHVIPPVVLGKCRFPTSELLRVFPSRPNSRSSESLLLNFAYLGRTCAVSFISLFINPAWSAAEATVRQGLIWSIEISWQCKEKSPPCKFYARSLRFVVH